MAIVATASAVFLETFVKVGHELWLTALGFLLGVTYGAHEPPWKASVVALVSALGLISLTVLNIIGIKDFNVGLIAFTSIALAVSLTKLDLRLAWLSSVAKLDRYLLEIFLIHTYLFFYLTRISILDFTISMSITLTAAMLLNKFAGKFLRDDATRRAATKI